MEQEIYFSRLRFAEEILSKKIKITIYDKVFTGKFTSIINDDDAIELVLKPIYNTQKESTK